VARDSDAWPSLLRLLQRPADEVDRLLGDAVTLSLPKIAIGMFDSDSDSLFTAIAERTVGEFERGSLLAAVTFLTWEGRIDRDRMGSFLERLYAERLAEDGDFAWEAWLEAIALLGLRDLAPLVRRAWDEGA
jgi:hypothetical protein